MFILYTLEVRYLGRLSLDDKDEIASYFLSGLRYVDIAKIMGVSLTTVRRVLDEYGLYVIEDVKICDSCGVEFKPTRHGSRNQKYCSDHCRYLGNKGVRYVVKRIKKCRYCNATFVTKDDEKEFCSNLCKRKEKSFNEMVEKGPRNCLYCEKSFYSSAKHYCSDECKRKASRVKSEIRKSERLKRARSNGPFDADIDIYKLIERDGGHCYLCGDDVLFSYHYNDPKYPTIEHVLPISKGGSHSWDNVKVACRECNTRKSTTLIDDYLKGR